MHKFYTDEFAASGICHITGIWESPMSSSLFSDSVIPVHYNKFPQICMQRDWFMYHLRSNYKNSSGVSISVVMLAVTNDTILVGTTGGLVGLLSPPPPPPIWRYHAIEHLTTFCFCPNLAGMFFSKFARIGLYIFETFCCASVPAGLHPASYIHHWPK